MEQKFRIDKIIRMYFADENGNPKSNIVEVNKTVDELDKEYRDGFTSETKNVTVHPKEENKLIAQGKNYKITQKYSEYTDDNGIAMVYPSIARDIVKKYKSQYEGQQNQKYIEIVQHDALLNITSVALDGTKDTIAVSGGYGNKTLAEFGEQVDDACFLPIAEVVKGTELDYHNTTETKHKTFEEMSYEEKIKSVNKEIENLLDFIERNKQAKYNKWRKERQ